MSGKPAPKREFDKISQSDNVKTQSQEPNIQAKRTKKEQK